MRTTTRIAALAASLMLAMSIALRADDDRLQNAGEVLTEMTVDATNGIAPSLIVKAKCIAIIPGVKKAALGIGGQYGRGYIVCRREGGSGWSAPGAIRIEGGSFGLQIGGEATDVILLVLNDHGADRLLSSKFTVGADAAVAAGPVGRQASAATDVSLNAEILAWSRSRGAFAGISLQGSTLRTDSSENDDLYGKGPDGESFDNKAIVRGTMAPPKSAAPLMTALGKL